MPYGHPTSTGHGLRTPSYRWSPSVLPPSRRHARRGRRRAPAFDATPEPSAAATRRTRRRPAARTAALKPSAEVARLFGKMAASLAAGFLEMVEDMLTSPKRVPDSYASIVSSILFVGAMAHSTGFFVVGGFLFLYRFLEWLSSMATELTIEDYETSKKRLCIHRKTSVNAPPTPEAIREAWKAARGSVMGKLLAGTLLSDLEPTVDQSYLRAEDGTVVGRRPGLKGWLRENCPDMLPHYKALMSYKALADKLRRTLGVEDPDTLAAVLDFGEGMLPKSLQFRKCFSLQNSNGETVSNEIHSMFGNGAAKAGEPDGNENRENIPKTSVNTVAMEGPERAVRTAGRTDCGGMEEAWTMAALDAAIRERLGLAWMHRGRRKSPAA